jgi:predicted transcriptional regulator
MEIFKRDASSTIKQNKALVLFNELGLTDEELSKMSGVDKTDIKKFSAGTLRLSHRSFFRISMALVSEKIARKYVS